MSGDEEHEVITSALKGGVVRFMHQPSYPREINPLYLLNRRLVESVWARWRRENSATARNRIPILESFRT
jgi:hypothetical protein